MDVTDAERWADEARRRRRTRWRIYEAAGVALFMVVVFLALWWYVALRTP